MRGQDHRGVARVDAGELDVFEQRADDDRAFVRVLELPHVGDAIDIDFGGVFQKFVHQHGPLRRSLDGEPHVMSQFAVRINNLHRPAAEHEGRADQDRVAELARGGVRLGFIDRQAVGRLRDIELAQERGEKFAVFGDFDALRRGADDVDAVLLQTQRQIKRGLAAELSDGAPAAFALVNVEDVFEGKRLEEQFVARVVVGGDGFGVGIDHQGFEPVFAKGESGVHAAVVEFDALPDTIWPAAEDHYFLLVGGADFVIPAIIGRIVIRGVGLELGGAGIHEAVAGKQAEAPAFRAHRRFGLAGQVRDLAVGETERFGFGQQFRVHVCGRRGAVAACSEGSSRREEALISVLFPKKFEPRYLG